MILKEEDMNLTLLLILFLLLTACNLKEDEKPVSAKRTTTTDEEPTAQESVTTPEFFDGEEWIQVPANAGGMGLASFYVMKHEAKGWRDTNSDGLIDTSSELFTSVGGTDSNYDITTPVSVAQNKAWFSIPPLRASAACASRGENYDLISNEEWIAIARDVEGVDANWTGGSVGSGCLFNGNSAHSTCGYGTQLGETGVDKNVRGIHTLSNAETIYDMAANFEEFVDWDKDTPGFQTAPTTCSQTYTELPSVNCAEFSDTQINTLNGTYTTSQGVGIFYGNNYNSDGTAIRGGYWSSMSYAGIYALNFVNGTYGGNMRGFRCVYRP